jgi:hypothetical protein
MLADLPTLSAEELHKYLVRAFRLGNGARYRFAEGLCAMEEGKLYLELSYPTIYAYAEEEFHLGRSQTAEHLRVGKKLARLPSSTQAFLDGRLSFSGLGCITRVATPETEADWIDFAQKKSYEALRREVQDAAEKRRDHPRPDGSGLPYVKTRVYFDFTPEELDLFRKAIAKVTLEMGESLGGDQVEPKAVVLYIAHLILSSDAPGVAGARTEREAALFQVLYHICRRCHSRELMTKDGPVEVPAEVVERVEGDAEWVDCALPPRSPGGGRWRLDRKKRSRRGTGRTPRGSGSRCGSGRASAARTPSAGEWRSTRTTWSSARREAGRPSGTRWRPAGPATGSSPSGS